MVQPPVGVQPPEPLGPQTVLPSLLVNPVSRERGRQRGGAALSGAATPPVGSSLAGSTSACAMQRHRFGQRRPEACLQLQPASPVQPDLVWWGFLALTPVRGAPYDCTSTPNTMHVLVRRQGRKGQLRAPCGVLDKDLRVEDLLCARCCFLWWRVP